MTMLDHIKDAILFTLFGIAVGTCIGLALIFVHDVVLR